jgi:hypothetical protein
MVQSKPDLDNYMARITEIEELIVPGSIAVKNPKQVPRDYPYWLHIAGSGSPIKGSSRQWEMVLTIRAWLVRGTAGAMGDYTIEKTIMDDIITVAWNFLMIDGYNNLKTPTYPDIQAGYALDSLTISNGSRYEGQTVIGGDLLLGSIHTLTFSHHMFNTP